MGILDLFSKLFNKSPYAGEIRPCPNCKEKIDLGWERCPKCGVHLASMFKKKCPKCEKMNDLNASMCKNTECNYNFAAELERAKKKAYKCPICGYEAGYFMMQCPACGTRFG